MIRELESIKYSIYLRVTLSANKAALFFIVNKVFKKSHIQFIKSFFTKHECEIEVTWIYMNKNKIPVKVGLMNNNQ